MKPSNESQPRYGIRKFTVGVDSAVIGSVLFLTPTVQATESLSHAPAVPVQVKDRSAGMEKEKPIQKKEDKVIPQGVQLADTPQPQKDLTKKKTAKEADDKHSVAVDLLRALIDEGEKKLRTLAKDHLSYQALEEALNRAKRVIGDLTPRPQIPCPSTDIEKEPDKEIPSSVPHKEGGKEDSKNTMEVASPAQESQAGKPKSLPKTGAEAEMISLGVCLLVGGLSVIFNPFKRDQK